MGRKEDRRQAGSLSGRQRVKRSRVRYEMKASYENNRKICTVLDISADKTLDDLCEMILDAFDFDYDHLYLFNFSGRGYGEGEHVYYFMPDAGQKSTNVKLGNLNLVPKQKFYLLYDFGDDWGFDIQVQKIYETEDHIIDGIVSVKGELEQYPDDFEDGMDDFEDEMDDWEDWLAEYADDLEDDMGMFIFRLDPSLSIRDVLGTLDEDTLRNVAGRFLYPLQGFGALEGKTGEWIKNQYARALLKDKKRFLLFLKGKAADVFYYMMTAEIDPEDHSLDWLDLMDQVVLESEMDIEEISVSMMYLYSVGICQPELDPQGQIQNFRICGEVRKAYETWIRRPGSMNSIADYQKMESLANALMYRYGVIEIDSLQEICQEYTDRKMSREDFVCFLAGRLEHFNRCRLCEKDGVEYLSAFGLYDVETVLEARKDAAGLTYRRYTVEELDEMTGENPYGDVDTYMVLMEALWNSVGKQNIQTMGLLLRTVTELALMGTDSEKIIGEVRSILNSCGKRMTKKLQELIRKTAADMPLATQYGYTRAELEKLK